MVFTRKRPIEPTWGILQDVWISLTLSLETRSMSQARMPGFLPARLPRRGAVSPKNLPVPAGAGRVPRSLGCSRESYRIRLFVGLGDVSKQRGFAAPGSLISQGLPHALPEGEEHRGLCVSKSLGVRGEPKERKMGYLTQEFPGEQNSKLPLCSSSSVNVHMLPVAYEQYKHLLAQHII